jgi:hypothetical protein
LWLVDPSERQARLRDLEQQADKSRERLRRAALLLEDGSLDRAGYDLARECAEDHLQAAEMELTRLGAQTAPPKFPNLDTLLSCVRF